MYSCGETCEESVRRLYLPQDYYGTVTNLLFDKRYRGLPSIEINDSNSYECIHTVSAQLKVGDYVIKQRGSLKYNVIRDSIRFYFYPICKGWLLIKEDTVISLR